MPAALLALAATQFGLISRMQARAHGVSDGALKRRVRNGRLERIAPGVFGIAGTPPSWQRSVLAACLGAPGPCVASHRTAAVLHGFDGFAAGVIEVTVPRAIRYRRSGVVVHQSLDLVASDCAHVGSIPVTSTERTLIDLGAVTTFDRVEDAFDSAERDRSASRGIVRRRHAEVRKQGRRGVGPMAVALADRPAVTPHSVLERAFLRLLENAGLPMPRCQHVVTLADGRTVRIDAAYVDPMLGFELDGHGSHATRAQRAADNKRQNALRDAGWDIRRFTYDEVMREGPSVVRAVRSALTQHGSCDKFGRLPGRY